MFKDSKQTGTQPYADEAKRLCKICGENACKHRQYDEWFGEVKDENATAARIFDNTRNGKRYTKHVKTCHCRKRLNLIRCKDSRSRDLQHCMRE